MSSIDPFTVFNTFEIEWKQAFSRVKLRLMGGLVSRLVRLGVSANLVSFGSFASALVFFAICELGGPAGLAMALLAASVFFDNLDGTVADYVGHREAGPLVDVFYDLAALACILSGLASRGAVGGGIGLLFWTLYVLIMAGAFWTGPCGAKPFVARPRAVVYVGLLLGFLWPSAPIDLDGWLVACVAFQIPSLLSILVVGWRNRAACRLPPAHRLLGPGDLSLALVTTVLVAVVWVVGLHGARG